MRKVKCCLCRILVFSIVVGVAGIAWGADLRSAPMSRTFEQYVSGLNAAHTRSASAASRVRRGYGISPVDLSHLAETDYAMVKAASLPASFDLRMLGLVPSVKNQGSYGTCWTFAAMGALESSYLKETGQKLDLSEVHLAWFTYKESPAFTLERDEPNPLQNGGFDSEAVATLARYIGAVEDRYLPYPYGQAEDPNFSVAGRANDYPNRLHLQHAFFLEPHSWAGRALATEETMKTLLTRYGAAAVYLCVGDDELGEKLIDYYNPQNAAFYYDGPGEANHAVLLIGWDDGYSRENFREDRRPQSDGAWLIQNSWGTDFGKGGCFWVSYESRSFGGGTVYLGEETGKYSRIYAHDDLGWCESVGELDESGWMANVYRARSAEKLEAVAFYTTAANARYEIRVYTALGDTGDPTDGTLAATLTGTEPFAGYHTLKLSEAVALKSGSSFSIVVKMVTPNYPYPLALEAQVFAYSENASAAPGESFYSDDGQHWTDINGDGEEGNFCLKAFTNPDPDETDHVGSSSSGGCDLGTAGFLACLLTAALRLALYRPIRERELEKR